MDWDRLKLPLSACVNKFIPKNKFYEKAALTGKIQKAFTDKIQKITWKYKLAEDTIGISKTEHVTEIQIFEIELKEQVIPKNLLKIIDRAIPYPILYCFVYHQAFAWAITLKQENTPENYYIGNWDEDMVFDFTGINLEKVYQKLVQAFIRPEAKKTDDFNEWVDTDTQIKSLENEISMLEKKIRAEKQFNRKVEIHKILLEKQDRLKQIQEAE